MRKTCLAALAATAVVAAGPALADPQWTYGQVGYSVGDEEGGAGGGDTDAFGISGSLEIAEIWHVAGGFASGEIGGADHDFYEIVGGLHPAVSETTDVVLELGYGSAENDDFSNSDRDILRFTAGARSMVTQNLEINGGVTLADVDADSGVIEADGTKISAQVGGRYLFTEQASVGVGYAIDSVTTGDDLLSLDFRWAFADLF